MYNADKYVNRWKSERRVYVTRLVRNKKKTSRYLYFSRFYTGLPSKIVKTEHS